MYYNLDPVNTNLQILCVVSALTYVVLSFSDSHGCRLQPPDLTQISRSRIKSILIILRRCFFILIVETETKLSDCWRQQCQLIIPLLSKVHVSGFCLPAV